MGNNNIFYLFILMNTYDILNNLNTGDLILFQGKHSLISSLINIFTNSRWTHIGIVLKDPEFIDKQLNGLYLWESGKEDFPDSEDNKYKYGTQIVDLKEKIDIYDGIVVARRLKCNRDKFDTKLKIIHNTVHNKPYDDNIFDFIMTKLGIKQLDQGNFKYRLLNWLGYNPRKVDKMYCSSLVAYIYTELGLIDANTRWTDIFPVYFSSENPNLKLLNATLGPEEYIHG